MSGADWKAAARKDLRAAIRAALETQFDCAFASPSGVIVREGDRYGIVNLQTSTTSGPEALELYVNYGTGHDAWFRARGYGPPKPRSEADCEHRARHDPDPRRFPDTQFARFRIPMNEWADPLGRNRLTDYLTEVVRREIAPWIVARWSERPAG